MQKLSNALWKLVPLDSAFIHYLFLRRRPYETAIGRNTAAKSEFYEPQTGAIERTCSFAHQHAV